MRSRVLASARSACSCAALALLQAVAPAPAGPEPIKKDYSNVRGLNYVASYAPSDVAMWRFYDHDQIDRELGYMAGLGANSVRVWLAWVVYEAEGEKFLVHFADFLELAGKHHLSVMPILWDSCFGDAAANYDDVRDWVANPGFERVKDPQFRAQGDAYVRAVVERARDSAHVLMWDIMNEPAGPKINDWLGHYSRLTKSLDERHPITIGWARAKFNEVSADWVDVLSYHPYGIFPKNREVWTRTMQEIAARHGNKPILANEVGAPGYGQRYEEVIEDLSGRGVGFYLFEAMIGVTRFRAVQGLFFADGTVREMEPVLRFQALARGQGGVADGRYSLKTGGEGFIPICQRTGAAEIARMVQHWEREEVTAATVDYYQNMLRWTYFSLMWGKALSPADVEQARQLQARADELRKAGDMEPLREVLSQQVELARKRLLEHGFISASE